MGTSASGLRKRSDSEPNNTLKPISMKSNKSDNSAMADHSFRTKVDPHSLLVRRLADAGDWVHRWLTIDPGPHLSGKRKTNGGRLENGGQTSVLLMKENRNGADSARANGKIKRQPFCHYDQGNYHLPLCGRKCRGRKNNSWGMRHSLIHSQICATAGGAKNPAYGTSRRGIQMDTFWFTPRGVRTFRPRRETGS